MTAPTTDAPTEATTDMTLDQLLEQLGDVSDDHVAAGITAVQGRAAELKGKAKDAGLTAEERDEATSLADAYGKLAAEKATRDEAAAAVNDALGAIPDVEPVTEQADEPKADTEVEQPPATSEAVAASADAAEPKATTPAKLATPRLPLGTITRDKPLAATAPRATEARAAIVAAAGDRDFATGQQLTAEQLHTAIWERQRRLAHSAGSSGDYVVVASIEHPTTPDRYLRAGDEIGNTRRIESVTAPTALTAAGVCAPYTIDYSMDAIGSLARPVRDSFPQYVADRGGVQFRRDVDALGSGPISASGTWTLATDAAPGDPDSGGSTKPIWEVPCNTVVSAEVQAVTLGLKFSNITNRFDPEAVAANTKAASIAHARYAEMLLLNTMYAQVTATFTQDAAVSAARDLLAALDKAIAYARNNRRQGPEIALRTFLPLWIKDLIRVDMVRALHTSNEEWLALSDSAINQWFANRNVNVTWMLDGRAAVTGSGSGTTAIPTMAAQGYSPLTGTNAMPGFPDTVEFPLFAEGTFVYLDGGSLDVGVVRDQTLVQTNRYIQFSETFEGLYRKGVEALRCVVGVQPTGRSASTMDTSALTD